MKKRGFLFLAILNWLILSAPSASAQSTYNPSSEFFASEELFAAGKYAESEQKLETVLADLKKRPADERPSLNPADIIQQALLARQGQQAPIKVNVHNYSIMTIELLSKCKYALGKYNELAALTRAERPLVAAGYTGTFAANPVDGPQLYIVGFEAVAYMQAGKLAEAEKNLAWCKGLTEIASNPQYVWLGDKGSPDFGRYLWLKTRADLYTKENKPQQAQQLAKEIASLKTKLNIR